MIIRKYGVELHRLTHDDIELVRQARNSDSIRKKMFNQQIITPEQQEAWFRSIDNIYNYYFVIKYNNKKIGLIYGNSVDFAKRESNGGMFIWDNQSIGTPIPAMASILYMDASYTLLDMQRTFIRVREDNKRAYHYNLSQGYEKVPGTNKLVLTKASFKKHIAKLRWLASGGKDLTRFSLNEIEFEDGIEKPYLYLTLPPDILRKIWRKLPDQLKLKIEQSVPMNQQRAHRKTTRHPREGGDPVS
jgi:hypothetical protein